MPTVQNHNATVGVPNTPGPHTVRQFMTGDNPYFEPVYTVAGVSRDAAGASLPGCTCILYRIVSPVESRQEQDCVSDANGNYSFNVDSPASNWRVTFDLAGSPIRAGLTLKTLVGV